MTTSPRAEHDVVITTVRRGESKSGRWHDGPEGCTLPIEECVCDKGLLEELRALSKFAYEREHFGILTEIQNGPDPDEGTRGNPRAEGYGAGYSEASRDFISEIERRIDMLLKKRETK